MLLCSSVVFGQSNEIKIKFLGNCGLYTTDGNMNIYFDFPYKSGAFNYMEYDSAELDSIKENSIFVFTHKHPDHYASRRMGKVLRKKKGQKYEERRRILLHSGAGNVCRYERHGKACGGSCCDRCQAAVML